MVGIGFYFYASIMISLPHYFEASGVTKLCPNCGAPKFESFMFQIFSFIVGDTVITFFTIGLLPMFLMFAPALVRGTTRVAFTNPNYRYLPFFPALFSSVVLLMPLGLLFQVANDWGIRILIIFLVFFPSLFSVIFFAKNILVLGITWSVAYLSIMLALIIYTCSHYNLWENLWSLMTVPFVCGVVAQFCLSFAIVQDMLELFM